LVELAKWQERFQALGVNVAAMTYDDRATLASFHNERKLRYPLLQDVGGKHVIAYGIINEQYQQGGSGYVVPHPGVIFLSNDGIVILKFAYPGFRNRPSFDAIYSVIADE